MSQTMWLKQMHGNDKKPYKYMYFCYFFSPCATRECYELMLVILYLCKFCKFHICQKFLWINLNQPEVMGLALNEMMMARSADHADNMNWSRKNMFNNEPFSAWLIRQNKIILIRVKSDKSSQRTIRTIQHNMTITMHAHEHPRC